MKLLPLPKFKHAASALAVAVAAAIVPSAFSQATSTSPSAATSTAAVPSAATDQPNEAEMMKQMMELSKLTENHKLLGQLAGSWTFVNKMWMSPDPKAQPIETKGTAVRKPLMDGRYYVVDFTGSMPMPGPDGKMKDMGFKGMSIEGYDNVKQKFVGTWCDSMSTGIALSEGTYDASTKTFNYTMEMEMVPGMKQKVREALKIVDKDHHVFEWYEDRGGQEVRTMEISYTRKK
jgi:hypothetical protein